jgi:hypothetical protein
MRALGLYRRWFTFSKVPEKDDGRPGIALRIDENKTKADAEKTRDKLAGLPSSAKEGSGGKRPGLAEPRRNGPAAEGTGLLSDATWPACGRGATTIRQVKRNGRSPDNGTGAEVRRSGK